MSRNENRMTCSAICKEDPFEANLQESFRGESVSS